jgi:TPR repeat protein
MASQGDKDAAFDLGVVYHTGSYKQKKNGNEMVKWWEKAAEEEVCDAVYNLAMVYHHGFKSEQDPVEVDLEKAAEWYLKAADLGRKEARGFAAECKAVIEGRKQRELEEMGKGEGEGDQALQYYELAAEGGDVPAMFKLGNCHAKGNLGQEVDYVKACEWWAKAAGEGHVLSTENILEHAGFNTKELKTDEILEDKLKEAMPKITGILANMYRWGNGVERDEGKCMELYKRSARMGNAESMFVLGAINDGGEFLSIGEKKEEGKAWMRKARDAGDARAKKWCRDYDR